MSSGMGGKRQGSKYWDFFDLIFDNSTNRQRTQCKICSGNVSLAFNKNTSAMKAHLSGKHKISLEAPREAESSEPQMSQPLMTVIPFMAGAVMNPPADRGAPPTKRAKIKKGQLLASRQTASANAQTVKVESNRSTPVVVRKPIVSCSSAAAAVTSTERACSTAAGSSLDRANRVTKKLIQMFAVDVCPLSIVDGIGFRRLVKEMDPTYKLPTLPVLRRHLEQEHRERKDELIARLSTVDSVALSVDVWSSSRDRCSSNSNVIGAATVTIPPNSDCATGAYITITCHYVDDDWQSKYAVLATRRLPPEPARCGSDIARHVEDVRNEFRVTCVTALTHDDAAHMDEACRELCVAPEAAAICFDRSIRQAVAQGLCQADTQSCLEACVAVVGYFGHCSQAAEELRLRQRELWRAGEPSPPALTSEFPTDWTGTYAMLQAIVANRLAVYAVFNDRNAASKLMGTIRPPLPSENQWELAESLCAVLRPLDLVVRQMACESYPDVGAIYPLIHVIISNQLATVPGDRPEINHFKTNCAAFLTRRFKIGREEESDEVIACCLHPSFKKLKFLSAEAKSLVVARLKLTVATVQLPPTTSTVAAAAADSTTAASASLADAAGNNTSSRTNKYRLDSSAASAMKYLMEDLYDTSDEEDESCDGEVERYLADNHRIQQTLPWWRANHSRYPRLAVLARRMLARPATAVPTDRVCSAGSVDARTTLDPDTVDAILFLNSCERPKRVAAVAPPPPPLLTPLPPKLIRIGVMASAGGGTSVEPLVNNVVVPVSCEELVQEATVGSVVLATGGHDTMTSHVVQWAGQNIDMEWHIVPE